MYITSNIQNASCRQIILLFCYYSLIFVFHSIKYNVNSCGYNVTHNVFQWLQFAIFGWLRRKFAYRNHSNHMTGDKRQINNNNNNDEQQMSLFLCLFSFFLIEWRNSKSQIRTNIFVYFFLFYFSEHRKKSTKRNENNTHLHTITK